jgi:hypothetical protein
MNQKIERIEKELKSLGKKNDDMTCLQRMGKLAELMDEYKKIIINKGKI